MKEISTPPPSGLPKRHTQSRQFLEDGLSSWVERKTVGEKLPSLRSRLEIGVLNPNLWASTLIVIVLMTVSPRMIVSEAMMSPLAANCTDRSNVSEMQGASL